MKKLIFTLSALVLLCGSVFAFDQETEDNLKAAQSSAADTLRSTGRFLKGAGKDLSEKILNTVDSINEFKCYGTWVHNGKNTKTTITFNKDGTMEIVQRSGLEIDTYSGTFENGFGFVTFNISEQSHKDWIIINNGDRKTADSIWTLHVSLEDEENAKISSSDIPDEKEGVSFYKGVVFKKQ